MKARVASHKPLSSHLARVRSLVEAGSDQSESEEETETPEDAAVKLDRITMNNQVSHLSHSYTEACLRRSSEQILDKPYYSVNDLFEDS